MRQTVSAIGRSSMAKVLALATALVFLGAVGGIVTNDLLADRAYERTQAIEQAGLAARLEQEIASQQAVAEQLAVLVANQPDVREAFAARDRAALKALLLPAFTTLKADYGMAQFQFHVPPATSFLRLHSPKKFGDDLSSFRHTVVTANRDHRTVSGVEGGVAGLGVRAVVPVTYEGRPIGTVEFGTSLGDAFVQRIAKQFEVGAALYDPGEASKASTSVATTLGEAFSPDEAALTRAGKGETVAARTVLGGRPELVMYRPLLDAQDDVVAVVVLAKDMSGPAAARTEARRMGLRYGLLLLAVGLVLGGALSVRISRSLTRPVRELSRLLEKVAEGDFTVRAPLGGDPAVAEMARRLNLGLETTSVALHGVLEASAELAVRVEGVVRAGDAMASAAGTAADQADTVARTAQEVSRNVEAAATGSEQMASSIEGIATSAEEAATVGEQAVRRAEMTNGQVERLGATSAQIGEVVQLISGIASQTNLLALNATIEAARAGELGKGFAVVAGEVKDLAHQTATATEDISQRIEAIQGEAATAVDAIEQIGAVIGQVNEFQTTIAAAVEEQTATTAAISRSVAEAAGGAREIVGSVSALVQSTHATQAAAADARSAAGAASEQTQRMRGLVAGFRLS